MKANKTAERHFATAHLLANLRDRTVSGALVTTVAQGAKFVLTLGSTAVLARLLQPKDFGLIAMVTTVTTVLQVFKDAGLSAATMQREDITHSQVSNLFWINTALGALISLVVVVSAPAIAWFYREPRLVAIALPLSLTFLANGSAVQHRALLSRQMRFKAIALIEIGSLLIGVGIGIGMALAGQGYWSLVGLNLGVEVSGLLLTWSVSRWRPQLPSSGTGTRVMLGFGANLSAAGLIFYVSRSVDGLLIGRRYGADAVGLYSRAMGLLMQPLQQLLSPIAAVFQPALSRLQGDPDRYRRTFIQIYESIAMAGLATTGLVLALSRPLTLAILGPQWGAAAGIFAGFTLATLYIPLSLTASWLFITQGRGRDLLVMNSILAVLTVAAFFAGLPWGPFGVAVAFSGSGLLLRLPVIFHLAGRRGPVSTPDLWVVFFRHLPLWFVAFGATYLPLVLLHPTRPIAQLLVCAPIGLAAVAGFAMVRAPQRRVVLQLAELARSFVRAQSPSPQPQS